MKITNFKSLKMSVEKYGVSEFFKTKIKEQIKKFETEGLDVDLSNIYQTNSNQLFTILPDGSISKAIIHIVDISNRPKHWEYPTFHIYNCKTIEEMKNENRLHRYKVSGRRDGKFRIIKGKKSSYEELNICQNCLNEYNSYYKENKKKSDFIVKEFLEKNIKHTEFKNVDLDICTIPSAYSQNWSAISKQMKEMYKYICQECFEDYSNKDLKKFLHTHHINANKSDNSRENLKVLCIACHANQYNHSHLKNRPDYANFMNLIKRKSA